MTEVSCELIKRAHLAGVSTTRAVWRHVAAALDNYHEQEPPQQFVNMVLDASVRSPYSLAAPRNPAHTREVMAWLAEQWRARGWKQPEEFHVESLPMDNSHDLYYKTYLGWGGGTNAPGVTLLESGGGITHSTTGLTTWCGAAVLAEWVTNNSLVVAGRRVLELGAGVGFSAATILTSQTPKHMLPSSYIATDCNAHVLTVLHHNLTLNLAEPPLQRSHLEEFQAEVMKQIKMEQRDEAVEKDEKDGEELLIWSPPPSSTTDPAYPTLGVVPGGEMSGRGRVGVMQVDWRRPPRLPPVDVVLAADVVYCHHLLRPLVTLLRSILEGNDGKEEEQQQKSLQNRGKNKVVTKEKQEQVVTEDGISEDTLIGTRGKETEGSLQEREAFFACTRRTHETMGLFLQEVVSQGLSYNLVYQATLDADTALFVYNETHLPVKIYRIILPQDAPTSPGDAADVDTENLVS